MKVSVLATVASLCVPFVAAAENADKCSPASVYLFSSHRGRHVTATGDSRPPQLDAHQGELVLADVAGASRLHRISTAEDARVVSSFVGRTPIFARRPDHSVVIVVEGVKPDTYLLDTKPSFELAQSSTGAFFEDLLDKFSQEIERFKGKVSHALAGASILSHYRSKRDLDALFDDAVVPAAAGNAKDLDAELHQDLIAEIGLVEALPDILRPKDDAFVRIKGLVSLGGDDTTDAYNVGLAALRRAIVQLIDDGAETYKVAVVAVPPNSCAVSRGSAMTKVKRANSGGSSRKASSGFVSSSSATFKSEQECNDVTHSCSGHGSCVKAGNKYACACKPSYDEDKKQTTYWGGSACQKIDVSIEFQLFFWTGIAIVFVTAAGIKLLAQIGSEPLPGVLSSSTTKAA